jgi:hypothetical protein
MNVPATEPGVTHLLCGMVEVRRVVELGDISK